MKFHNNFNVDQIDTLHINNWSKLNLHNENNKFTNHLNIIQSSHYWSEYSYL